MELLTVVPHVLSVVVSLVDKAPADEDVKAGWTAFAVFIALIVAVAVLGFSLVKHLRKAEAAQKAGAYGDEPSEESPTDPTP